MVSFLLRHKMNNLHEYYWQTICNMVDYPLKNMTIHSFLETLLSGYSQQPTFPSLSMSLLVVTGFISPSPLSNCQCSSRLSFPFLFHLLANLTILFCKWIKTLLFILFQNITSKPRCTTGDKHLSYTLKNHKMLIFDIWLSYLDPWFPIWLCYAKSMVHYQYPARIYIDTKRETESESVIEKMLIFKLWI